MKRILAVLVMVFSVIMVAAALGGIVGNWVLNSALTDTSLRLLNGLDTVLISADEALQTIGADLDDVHGLVEEVEETAVGAGEYFVEEPVVVQLLEELLDLQLVPAFQELYDSVVAIRDALVAA